ncbi:MAG: hypothetical protein ILP02_02405 [Clostridia bacterium]|nr:hypothetical protein [Clostridia bacterium]
MEKPFDRAVWDKRLERLYDIAKRPSASLSFTDDDIRYYRGVGSLGLIADKGGVIGVSATVSGVGTLKVFIDDLFCDAFTLSGDTKIDFDAYAEAGERAIKFDLSLLTDGAVKSVTVCGYVKKKNFDSRIFAINYEDFSLVGFYNGAKGYAEVTTVGSSGHTLIAERCKGLALSRLSDKKVIALTKGDDRVTARLIDLNYFDVMGSAVLTLSGARDISGGAGGRFYVVKDDRSVVLCDVDEYLDHSLTDTNIKAERVVAAPDATQIIVVGLDKKACLVQGL